ncbi:MAG: hypothetical protein JKY54_00730 [Flavobacteriales bacterium]|nr:hypothetical protein [Flavobacteriales bacterium]
MDLPIMATENAQTAKESRDRNTQKKTLGALIRHVHKFGYAPSTKELVDDVQGKRVLILEALHSLETNQFISVGKTDTGAQKPRAIRIIMDWDGNEFVAKKLRPIKKKRVSLTTKEQGTLDSIATHINEKGYAPTFRELADELDLSFNAIKFRVISLVEKEYLKQDDGIPRSYRIVPSVDDVLLDSELD